MVEIQHSYGKRSEYEIRLYHTEVLHSTDRRDLPITTYTVLVIQVNGIYV